MPENPASYHAYLLRFWRDESSAWRASLEDPFNGERRGFASLQQLYTFLEEQVSAGRLGIHAESSCSQEIPSKNDLIPPGSPAA
jgi:hypothetical protein